MIDTIIPLSNSLQSDSSKVTKNEGINESVESKSIDIMPVEFNEALEAILFKGNIKKNEKAHFPIDAFPRKIQNVVNATNACLNFPIDYISSSILYSAALAIGNTYKVQVKRNWEETAVLYLALVGPPGANKSHPLSFAVKPVEERDRKRYKEFKTNLLEYQENTALKKPIYQRHIISDFTIEALYKVHEVNERGIGVVADELTSWIRNFERYNKGSEEEFWLSNWSRKAINIDRKSSDPIRISDPFISVVGTIQQGVLSQLNSGKRSENGFVHRILFALPNKIESQKWNTNEISSSINEEWNNTINRLLDIPLNVGEDGNIKPFIIEFDEEAKKIFINWYDKISEQIEQESDENIKSIHQKMKSYAIRFSIILQLLYWSCDEGDKESIRPNAVKGALKIADYFLNTAIKINSIMTNNPIESLPALMKNLYEILPEFFATGEGVEFAKELGIPERTFKRFLDNKSLFDKIKRGEYEKKL